ncbi:MAG: PAS domain-containing sensor histidine kinase [Bacteroidia bacterium]|nr:PAS domain-containing sensor histidine kinase [Bacteroidia bacterium]
MNSLERTSKPQHPITLPEKKLKTIDHYTKEELYEQLLQLQNTAFTAQKEVRTDNDRLLKILLNDHAAPEQVEELAGEVNDQHKELLRAAYKLKKDVLDLENRFNLLEKLMLERSHEFSVQEQNLQGILENTHDQIFSVNKNYEILVFNTAAKEFATQGMGFEFYKGVNILENLPPKVVDFWKVHFSNAMKGIPCKHTFAMNVGDRTLHFQCSINPIKNPEGGVEGFSFFGRDITEIVAKTNEVRHQQDLLFSISKNIHEGIFRTTREAGIEYINQSFIELFGYKNLEEIQKINLDSLYAKPGERKEIVDFMQENNFFVNREVKFKKKDGSTFWGLMSSTKLQDEHGNLYFDGAVRDVTHLKEAQESLKKKNEELDRFVWSTSHDLRAPLVSVLGLIDITRMGTEDTDTLRYLNLMEVSIKKLETFIDDIKDYSQNDKLKIEISEIDLAGMLRETLRDFQYLSNSDKLDIRVIERGNAPFFSDAKRIAIILKNLLSNAINYADLSKEEPYIRVEIHHSAEETSLCIKDNGIGIREDCKDKVFDMFFRGSKKSSGTGIGLYIVKETVQKLNGRIGMESTEGVGSSFRIHLPNFQNLPNT